MKKIIKGKTYNTETAQYLGFYSSGNPSDLNHYQEELYIKKTGEYFLYGTGGPASKYSKQTESWWTGSEDILPMSKEAAMEWAERYLSAREYCEIFGEPEE